MSSSFESLQANPFLSNEEILSSTAYLNNQAPLEEEEFALLGQAEEAIREIYKGQIKTDVLKDLFTHLTKLVEQVDSDQMSADEALPILQPLQWAIQDYLLAAKARIEAEGSHYSTANKEIQEILSSFQKIKPFYQLPKKGLVGQVSQFFFSPSDPKERFFSHFLQFQKEIHQITIQPQDSPQAKSALKRANRAEMESQKSLTKGKKRLYTALFLSLFAGSQGIEYSHKLKQAAALLYKEPAKVTETVKTSPARRSWEPVVDEQCFPVEVLEKNVQKTMRKVAPDLLQNEAELSKYGNKHRNLVKMALLKEALGLPELEVPLPQGLSDEEVQSFLRHQAPSVFVHWEELGKLYQNHQGSTPFLDTPQAASLLQKIDQDIQLAFQQFDGSKKMQSWLEGQQKAGHYLMVRSTGAEDSKEMANAGGNASKAYVTPTRDAFSEAAGIVVRSYFSKESLQNRINSQTNPFTESLKLAVTAQELIGEPINGAQNPAEIPISFVLFTNEPLYVGNETFRVMRVSASYGHGEGVVNGQGIATDTALILLSESKPDQLFYIYNNQKKLQRLAPLRNSQGHVKLGKLENPVFLQNQPALSAKHLHSLFASGVLMEAFFEEQPTDIEGVIKKGKVHFVQARPIVRKPMLPTYLDLKDKEQHQAEVLVPGTASVVQIDKKQDVLFVPTLQEALHFSMEYPPKLVIVNHPEPENSHPVVMFSGYAIPCLYIPDAQAVDSLLDQIDDTHALAVCMQRGSLSVWDKAQLPESIHEGFAIHPAKVAISLPTATHFVAIEAPSKEIEDLIYQIREQKEPLNALQQLEQHSLVRRLRAKRIALSEMYRNKQAPQPIQERLAILASLDQKIAESFKEMHALADKPADRLQYLFQAKVLETLIMGTSASGLGYYSLHCVKSLCNEIDLLRAYEKAVPHKSHAIDLLLDGNIASPNAFEKWKAFLLSVEAKVEKGEISLTEWNAFKTFITHLKQSGALPVWLTFFQNDSIQVPPDQALMRSLLSEQQTLLQMRDQIEHFSDPHLFAENWKELKSKIDLYSSSHWLESLKTVSPIARSVAYKMMETAVDLLDTAAKTLKASRQFPQEAQKVKLFKEMLIPYSKMSQAWAEILVPVGALPVHGDYPLPTYFARVTELLNGMSNEDLNQFRPSRGFSVAAAMLGTGTPLDRHEPRTLEDILTLSHQNCLGSLNVLNQQLIPADQIKQSLLPTTVKQAMAEIEKASLGLNVQRVGMQVTEKEIVIKYNVPLRNHSGHLELHYDVHSGKMSLKGHLLGEARERWSEIAIWIRALEAAKILTLQKPLILGEQELIFETLIKPDQLPTVLNEYGYMTDYSMGGIFTARADFESALERLLRRYSTQPKMQTDIINSLLETAKNLKMQTNSISHSQLKDILSVFFAENIQIDEVIQILLDWSTLFDNPSYNRALDLIEIIIGRYSKYVPQLVAATKKRLELNSFSLNEYIKIFKFLVSKDLRTDEAIQVAETGLKSSNYEIWAGGLNLFEILISKDLGINEAIQAAETNIKSSDYFTRKGGLRLFEILISKNLGINEAIQTAETLLKSSEYEIRKGALDLFEILISKNLGIKEAIQTAEILLKSPDYEIWVEGLDLFKMLISQNLGINEVIQAAETLLKSSEYEIRKRALDLFEMLVTKGLAIDELIRIAETNIKSMDYFSREGGLELFKFLINKGLGINEAVQVAETNIKSTDYFIQQKGHSLFNILKRREHQLAAESESARKRV